ncbi:GTP-binding protein [Gordonia sp. CPCC 205515]|uniref:ribosome hibernation factor-recruiting GTPase MRF n=1 Tax=Gordonia sp. CPCC 205515 TaxID=3140791 RepID=UPI003AF3EB04
MKIIANWRSLVKDTRTPVILVSGLDNHAIGRTAQALVVAGTALVHHDLSCVGDGIITRTVCSVDLDGGQRYSTTELRLAHGCANCTLREDLLPMLRRLHRRSQVETIVVALDRCMEPEAVAFAINEVIVADMPGFLDAPAGDDVRLQATVTCVDESEWLDAAIGDVNVAEDSGPVDDERTIAQLAVGQVRFADALVIAGCDPAHRDAWQSARLMAVLRRLAPSAPIMMELPQRPITSPLASQLLAAIGPLARRGRVDDPHDPLLFGEPPLAEDCGVAIVEFHADRPFHPERLHEAVDILLDGVVTARGRLWLASQHDEAFWIESAGGGLRVALGGPWLAAMSEDELAQESADRRAMAALRWNDDFGDRHTSIVVLSHRADPEDIQSALRAACLTDDELAAGPELWAAYPDPFGDFHADPCEPTESAVALSPADSPSSNLED